MNVSIIICFFNEEQHIGQLLSGIMQQTLKDVEIIIVDYCSTDATHSIAFCYPTKIVYINPEEFTFGCALNVVCEIATDEYIVNASAHVYPVYNDWLERLLAPFADFQIALVYSKQRGNDIAKFSEHQILAKWFPDHSNLNQDHLFCNYAITAIQICKPLLKTFPEEWDAVMATNLRSIYLAVRYAYHLMHSLGGSIVNVSFVHAITTSLNIAACAASKGVPVALTRTMAIELSDNIRLNTVLSGVVDTPMLRASLNLEHIQGHNIEILMHEFGEKYVIGCVGQPEEIGQTILFLAYCQSVFINGQSINVDAKAIVRLSAG